MAYKPSDQPVVLVVDSDARALRLLEVGLRQAGYHVQIAGSAAEALLCAESQPPAVALVDTDLPDDDGFALAGRLRAQPGCERLLLLFLIDPRRPSDRLRAIEVGGSDVLDRPVYLKEALWRVETMLEKAAQRGELQGGREGSARFSGTLSGTTILDLLQSMEHARKSGLLHCQNARGQRGSLYISDGKAIDAEVGPLRGEDALYRLLTWRDGEYRFDLIDVLRPDRIPLSSGGLIMEAARRLDEWNSLCNAMPPLDTVLVPAFAPGMSGPVPAELPAELQDVLGSFNGLRTILDVVELDEELPLDALGRLAAIARLLTLRLLASRDPIAALRRPTPPPMARLTPPPAPRLTPPPMARLTPPPAARLTPPPMARLTPPPAARLTPPPMARLTPPPAARLTPPPMARLTPPPMSRPTPAPVPRPTPAPMPRLNSAPVPVGARLTPPPAALQTSNLAPAADDPAAATLVEAIPPVHALAIEHQQPSLLQELQPLIQELQPLTITPPASNASLPEISAEMLGVDASLSSDSQIRSLPISTPAEFTHSSDSSWRSGLIYAPARPEPPKMPSPIWRNVLTIAVGVGLFGVGMGLYWVFHELTRSDETAALTAPPPPVAQAPAPLPAPPAAQAPPTQPAPPAPVQAALPAPTPPPAPPAEPTGPAAAAQAPAPSETPPPESPSPGLQPPAPSAAQEAVPAAPTPEPAPTAALDDGYDALITKARAAMRRGQSNIAKRVLRDARRIRKDGAAALTLQAELAFDDGDGDGADKLAHKALQLEPTFADTYLILGLTAQARAQSSLARSYFRKYLELAPNGDRAKDVKAILRAGY